MRTIIHGIYMPTGPGLGENTVERTLQNMVDVVAWHNYVYGASNLKVSGHKISSTDRFTAGERLFP